GLRASGRSVSTRLRRMRFREEELSQIEARIDAGALAEADELSAKARLSEARARLATARAASPPTKPFVLAGNDGQAEVGFATLAEAVAAARTGDAVEIRRNGPIVVHPISVPGGAGDPGRRGVSTCHPTQSRGRGEQRRHPGHQIAFDP